jgi:hypothetical protein
MSTAHQLSGFSKTGYEKMRRTINELVNQSISELANEWFRIPFRLFLASFALFCG